MIQGVKIVVVLATGPERAVDRIPGVGSNQMVSIFRDGQQFRSFSFATAVEAVAKFEEVVKQIKGA